MIAKIFEYSRGIPRLIDSIAENALTGAFARQQKSVSEDIIKDVATDLRLRVATGVPLSAAAQVAGQEATVIKRLIELLQAVAAPGSKGPASAGYDAKSDNPQTPVCTKKPPSA